MNEDLETRKELPFDPEKYSLKEILRPERCALLVVDIQNDFCHPDGYFAKTNKADVSPMTAIVPHILKLIEIAHNSNVPIVFSLGCEDVSERNEPGRRRAVLWEEVDGNGSVCTQSGTWGAEFYQVKPEPEDVVIHKYDWSAFEGRDENDKSLDEILKERGVETLVIVGVVTETCVYSTIQAGHHKGYFVVVPKNSVGSNLPEQNKTVLEHIQPFLGDVVEESVIEENWPAKPQ